MSLRKTSGRKKSVTWKDSDETAASIAPQSSTKVAVWEQKFSLINIPFHYAGVIYYMLYVEYDNLIKFDKISYVLFKALVLSFLGQLVWLQLLPSFQDSKKSKSQRPSGSLIFAGSFLSLIAAFFINLFVVLLGAPILTFRLQTFLLSLHLAVLVVLPLIVTYQFSAERWKLIVVNVGDLRYLAANPVLVTAFSAGLGCWLGVITVPLDWDRDWQLYPISLVIGSYLGGTVGGLIALASRLVPKQ